MKTQLEIEFPDEEIIIQGIIWRKRSVKKGVTLWTSSYYSADGDSVNCYIDSVGKGFQLQCFSGIPASYISIDLLDYESIWRNIKLVDKSMYKCSFLEQTLIIANHFCSIHCEYVDISSYKTI